MAGSDWLLGGALGLGAIGDIVGSIIGSNAASSSAGSISNAANQSALLQLMQQQFLQNNTKMFAWPGESAMGQLASLEGASAGGNPLTAPLTAPYGPKIPAPFQWDPTQAQLASTPGYQFALTQGLQATDNAYAAQGLGGMEQEGVNPDGTPKVAPIGPLAKARAQYAEGLASQTYGQAYDISANTYTMGLQNYQQGYQNYLQQQQQIAGLLGGTAGIGASALTGTSGPMTQGTANIGQSVIGAGQANAAGQVGVANAWQQGLSGLSNNALTAALLLT
jgi:hypothetical protein